MRKTKAAEMPWQDLSLTNAKDNLRKAVKNLREVSDGVFASVLLETKDTLQLDMTVIKSDIADFLRLVNSDSPDDWERAVDIYHDMLLVDNTFEWIIDYDGKYDMQYRVMLQKLAKRFSDNGMPDKERYYRRKYDDFR